MAVGRAERFVERAGRAPISTRHVAAAIMVLALMTATIWATFTQTYHVTNLYAHLGLYGTPVRPPSSISLINRYPVARTQEVNRRIEVAGNFLLLAPIGVLLPLLWRGTKLRHVVAVALVASVTIELGQWAFTPNRIAQWSDVAQNVAGAAAAFLVVAPIRWLYRRRRRSTRTLEPSSA